MSINKLIDFFLRTVQMWTWRRTYFFGPDDTWTWQWTYACRVHYCPRPLTINKEDKFKEDLPKILLDLLLIMYITSTIWMICHDLQLILYGNPINKVNECIEIPLLIYDSIFMKIFFYFIVWLPEMDYKFFFGL